MRPLERKLKDMHSMYIESFGEHMYHLPSVDRWHIFAKGAVLVDKTFTYHESRLVRLVHAILDQASPGELITSPYEYVRIFAKAKYDKANKS